ncbi:aminoacyl-tRNA hydrolase [Candidatus Nomurabacteria bacterium]|nr:aminoacyl-tRNA hydrolase [Candidatus Nomurabacteria bacterium]
MNWIIVGLGNPTDRYAKTRHNIGRDIVDQFREENNLPDWEFDKMHNALISKGNIGSDFLTLILPETYMNDSGEALRKIVSDSETAQHTIVLYDDLDMTLGTLKISFNKNSGGHKGIESIINHIKTKEFIRLRIGISPAKKVAGEDRVKNFVLSKFGFFEKGKVKDVTKRSIEALELIMKKGYVDAMGDVNSWK